MWPSSSGCPGADPCMIAIQAPARVSGRYLGILCMPGRASGGYASQHSTMATQSRPGMMRGCLVGCFPSSVACIRSPRCSLWNAGVHSAHDRAHGVL